MPSTTVGRRQDAENHLAAAKEYIRIAESGDPERSAFEHAAIEIEAAMKDDPSLTKAQVARNIGKGHDYVGTLLRALARGRETGEFRIDWRRGSQPREERGAKRLAREHPDTFVEAFRAAPPAARKAIAKEISKAPEVRIAARKRDEEPARKPSSVKKHGDHVLYEYEGKLVSARRSLRDALALVDQVDQAGEDQDILDLLGMLKGLVEANDEAYRSGKSLDAWAWELYEKAGE
jgi:hypothetical protein